MPNSHGNSSQMRVQNETYAKITAVARQQRRAANAQLALIVDEWLATNNLVVDVAGVPPARRDTPAVHHTGVAAS